MKRFIKKVIAFAIVCAMLIILPSVLIDPYNVFHWSQIRNNGVEPNKNYIKTKYIIENPEKFDSFLFGSSRVGYIHTEKIESVHCYNMTYSVGVPAEHFENIKTFVTNGVNVKRVYVSLDSLSYTIPPETHYTDFMRCPYERISDWKSLCQMYLNPLIAIESLPTILKCDNISIEKADGTFYQYGAWSEYGMRSKGELSDSAPIIGSADWMEETLATIKDMVDYCNQHSIELVFFTNPMNHYTYEASVERDYLLFLKRLSELTSFYNFSGLNDITLNDDYYYDTSHYNAEVGDMMISCMEGNPVEKKLYEQGFGWYVTSENVGELLNILEGQENK